MGILNRVFASDKNRDKLVDGAVSGFDKMFFTKEERADASGKLGEWYLKYLAATQPQNLARRFIAIVVVLLWAALIIGGILIRWINYELSDYIYRILTDVVAVPFGIVIGFYFLTHVARAFQKK